jgi:hypothetical protein
MFFWESTIYSGLKSSLFRSETFVLAASPEILIKLEKVSSWKKFEKLTRSGVRESQIYSISYVPSLSLNITGFSQCIHKQKQSFCSTLSQKRWMISLLIMKRKSIHPMEWNFSFHRINAFYISLLTMKSSIAFRTVYSLS